MNFSEYQSRARETAIYHTQCIAKGIPFHLYSALEVADEAGEVAGKVKKDLRDSEPAVDRTYGPELRGQMCKELGDVLWALANLAADLGLTLDEIAEANLAKLADRKARGVLGGSGDNR